jgi:hypothetical protein
VQNVTYDIVIHEVIGLGTQFEDLLQLEDFLDKKLALKEGFDYRMHCRRSQELPVTQESKEYTQACGFFIDGKTKYDDEIEELEKLFEEQEKRKRALKKAKDEARKAGATEEEVEAIGLNFSVQVQSEPRAARAAESRDEDLDRSFNELVDMAGVEVNDNRQRRGPQNTKRKTKPKGRGKERKPQKPGRSAGAVPEVISESKILHLKKQRQKIIDLFEEKVKSVKELSFITQLNLDKTTLLQLDIPMRERLEEVFPELREFTIFCFKADSSVQRKALVFPSRDNETLYIETMKRFLQNHHKREVEALRSKLKISFRGKYLVKINRDLYQNFKDTIQDILREAQVKSVETEATTKIEISLLCKIDNPKAVVSAYERICDLLKAEEFWFMDDRQKDSYQFFALFSKAGQNRIFEMNNQEHGELFIELNTRFRQVILRGSEERKRWAVKELRSEYASLIQHQQVQPESARAGHSTERPPGVPARTEEHRRLRDHQKHFLEVLDERQEQPQNLLRA